MAKNRPTASFLFWGILLLGLALRIYQIGAKSFWFDESASIWISQRPLAGVLPELVRSEENPPLYYLLLHFWMAWGRSETVLRALSALFSVLTLPVMYLIGIRLGGRALGLLAMFILAVAPMHVHYAQDARDYALLTLNASLALLCMVILLEDPTMREGRLFRRPDPAAGVGWLRANVARLGMSVFTALTFLSHNTGIFLPASVAVFIALVFVPPALRNWRAGKSSAPPDRRWLNWTLLLVLAGVLCLPWLPDFLFQVRELRGGFWIPAPSVGGCLKIFREFFSGSVPENRRMIILDLGAFFALIVLGAWSLRKKSVPWLLLLLAWGPFAGELLASLARPILLSRTLIWSTVPFYLLLSAGLLQLRFRLLQAVALAVIVAQAAFSLKSYYDSPAAEDWRAAAAWVAPRLGPHDVIVFTDCSGQIAFDYYFLKLGVAAEEHGIPVDVVGADGYSDTEYPPYQYSNQATAAALPRLQQVVSGHPRVWFCYLHSKDYDPSGVVLNWLDTHLARKAEQPYVGVTIYQFDQP